MPLLRSRLGRRADAADGGARCDLCGVVVHVGTDGRCLLGHYVGAVPSPPAPPFAGQDAGGDDAQATQVLPEPAVAPLDPASEWDPASLLDDLPFLSSESSPTEPVGHPQAAALFAEAGQVSTSRASVQVAPPPAGAVPPPPLPAAGGRPLPASLASMYDDVLGWDSADLLDGDRDDGGDAAARPPAPASALDSTPDAPPVSVAAVVPPVPAHHEFDPADDAGEVRSALLRRATMLGGGAAVFAIAAFTTVRMAL